MMKRSVRGEHVWVWVRGCECESRDWDGAMRSVWSVCVWDKTAMHYGDDCLFIPGKQRWLFCVMHLGLYWSFLNTHTHKNYTSLMGTHTYQNAVCMLFITWSLFQLGSVFTYELQVVICSSERSWVALFVFLSVSVQFWNLTSELRHYEMIYNDNHYEPVECFMSLCVCRVAEQQPDRITEVWVSFCNWFTVQSWLHLLKWDYVMKTVLEYFSSDAVFIQPSRLLL